MLPHFRADPALAPFLPALERRLARVHTLERRLAGSGPLADFASAHEWYGLHKRPALEGGGWIFREYAPHATRLWLIGDATRWERLPAFEAHRIPGTEGDWELDLPPAALSHGQHWRLELEWPESGGPRPRIPAYARRVVQDSQTKRFCAQVWDPPDGPYRWAHADWRIPARDPLVYEAHVGMAQEEPCVGTWSAFRENILPRIARAGYNTLQLMAVAEHPYYGSFGYQVSSFFAPSSRFGTPEELKALIDAAHGFGLAVVMDLVHSHAVSNEEEGIGRFDGTPWCYCHGGDRGLHPAWGTRLFDYGRIETLHFLLSNCRYWLDEFHFDGFRFDGVTSMIYRDHGLGVDFTGFSQYFDDNVDEDALAYLSLANQVVHTVRPDALTVAEDVSGMPGLAAPRRDCGAGFDYRLAMGVTEAWGDLLRNVPDESWGMGWLLHRLSDKRADERTICYAECHDQALVGGKTMFFEMAGTAVYDAMHRGSPDLRAQRAVALHKMMRLATLAASGGGYLDFMGNEFGHPEWIDFPREGNGWSFEKARRRWSLRDDPALLYSALAEFGAAMIHLAGAFPGLLDAPLKRLVADDLAKTLAFSRGPLFFFFNFHPERSLANWAVAVPPGRYALALDTDRADFGGQGRIAPDQVFKAKTAVAGDQSVPQIRLYLPARTALVLERRK